MLFPDFIFYLLFIVILVVIIMCFIINKIVNKGTLFRVWQIIYLLFLTCHSAYIFFIYQSYKDDFYLNAISPFSLFYGPFYFSALYVLVPVDVFKFSKIIRHFYPTLFLTLIYFIIVFFIDDVVFKLWYLHFINGFGALQCIFYAIISFAHYNKYSTNSTVIASMSQSLLFLITISLFFICLLIIDYTQISNQVSIFLIYSIVFSALMILFSYNIILFKRIINADIKPNVRKISDLDTIIFEEETRVSTEGNSHKYQKSRIKDEEINDYLKKVQNALNEKIYLDSELSLEKFSKTLKIPKYHLTQVFNLGLGTNFNQLINKHRVEYAVFLLKNPLNSFTVEEIGLKSGFTSRASFYRAFSQIYGMSPNNYKKTL